MEYTPYWVKVTDYLPKQNLPVLCNTDWGIIILYYCEEQNGIPEKEPFWYDKDNCDYPFNAVTHWMPLPEEPTK